MSVTIEQTCLPETLAGGETLGKVLESLPRQLGDSDNPVLTHWLLQKNPPEKQKFVSSGRPSILPLL